MYQKDLLMSLSSGSMPDRCIAVVDQCGAANVQRFPFGGVTVAAYDLLVSSGVMVCDFAPYPSCDPLRL